MTIAEYVAGFLAAQGVPRVFALSGGMITPLLDALGPSRVVAMRHEQAAGFAAEGWARMTGLPGVAMATSGPGATNLITAIASCYFDSVPAVFLTGQVPTFEHRRTGQRQRGFQETPIVEMVRPITKMAISVPVAAAVPGALVAAFTEARGNRPGPVLVDLPFDVQRDELAGTPPAVSIERACTTTLPEVEGLRRDLQAAERPLVLLGGGVRASGAVDAVRRVLEALRVPVVHSLMAKDVLTAGHPLAVGMIGTYGNRWANKALAECDLLLVLGSRLDLRQLGSDPARALAGKIVWRVDIDPAELDAGPTTLRVNADLADFCTAMGTETPIALAEYRRIQGWRDRIAAWRDRWPARGELTAPEGTVHPLQFLHTLGEGARMGDVAAVVTDVGSHQMWAAQAFPAHAPMRFLTPGGHGAMGFGLPAAIGAALAAPDQSVVLVTGDASIQVNGQELATLAELRLPVKIVVLDNAGHGMVRGMQDRMFGGRHVATESCPVLLDSVARASGLIAFAREAFVSNENAIYWVLSQPGPALLHVRIDPSVGVSPHLPYGRALDDMEPHR